MLTDRAEEILETLWIEVVENKRVPEIRVLKDNEAFKELISKGYVSLAKKELLTPKGMEEARQCVRRHRLAERLLTDVLNVKRSLIHETSCKLEHILHKGIEDNICILLGHPKTCPHGRPIPEGKCCKKRFDKAESILKPLSDLKKGEKGKIAYIRTNDRNLLRKLIAMGTLPGVELVLIQNFPSYVFQIGETQFAVDKEIAEEIQVWVLK